MRGFSLQPGQRERRPIHCLQRAIVMVAAALAFTLPAAAQEPGIPQRVLPMWCMDVAVGMLAQPSEGGRTGPALSVATGRRVTPRVRVTGMLLGARIADVRAPDPDRYVVDRDWSVAAVGVETPVVATGRTELALVGRAGAMWARDRRVGVEGTPVPPGFPDETEDSSWWNAGAVVIPEIRLTYHVTRALAVTTGAAAIQHVFTDDFFGATGSLVSLGATFGW